MRVDVSLKERVLAVIDGKPQKYLGPGRYRMVVAPWRKVEVKRLDTDALVADLRAEELALVPAPRPPWFRLRLYPRCQRPVRSGPRSLHPWRRRRLPAHR